MTITATVIRDAQTSREQFHARISDAVRHEFERISNRQHAQAMRETIDKEARRQMLAAGRRKVK